MSEADQSLPDSFKVGDWTAHSDTLTVRRGGISRPLEPKAFDVLRYLAERPDKLVKIDELMDELWSGTVVTPNAVTRVVAQLRKALEDDASQPRYIETVARTGYRCIATVGGTKSSIGGGNRNVLLTVVTVALIALGGWVLWPNDPPDPSVAVLPFANFTGDDSMGYIGDGVAEEIINALAQVTGLQVSARTRSFNYRDTELDLIEVASILNVAYIVEGSVRRNGTQLRFTAQLIRADTGNHVWSDTADYDVLELFAGQEIISNELIGAFVDELGMTQPTSSATANARPDPEAYDLYLRGRQIWHRRGTEPLQPAIDYFAEATKIDPSFARGWSALASAYLTYPSYSPKGYPTWALAEGIAEKALALDPGLAEPYSVLGTFAKSRRDWALAEENFLQGIRRNERSATAHFWYAEFLAGTGRLEKSYVHLLRANDLDPFYLPVIADFAWANLHFGDANKGSAIFADLWAKNYRGPEIWVGNLLSQIVLGNAERAREWIELAPNNENVNGFLDTFADIYFDGATDHGLIKEIVSGDGPWPDHRTITWVASFLSSDAELIDYLRFRKKRGWSIDTYFLLSPNTDFRLYPEVGKLMLELGLVDFWDEFGWGDLCRREGSEILCDGKPDISMLQPLTNQIAAMPEILN